MVGMPGHAGFNTYPLANFANLKTTWDKLSLNINWRAPSVLLWEANLDDATHKLVWAFHTGND
jgi:hypothetical protein